MAIKHLKRHIILVSLGSVMIWLFSSIGHTNVVKNNSQAIAPLPEIPADVGSPSSNQEVNTPEYVILQPSDIATLSSETSAVVSNLNVKEGSHFEKGQLLLTLDCRVQLAELRKAEAQKQVTDMAIVSAKKLKAYDAISQFELVKAESDAQMANADVEKLKAVVSKCEYRAPFNGAVSELKVHLYDSVKPGDPLMQIVNTENLIIELQIPSKWLQWLHVGSNFTVHINELNENISATITRINPQIEPVSQTVKVIAAINKTDLRLLPGMSGQATFPDASLQSNKSKLP